MQLGRHFVSRKEARDVHDTLMGMGIDLPPDGIEIDQRKGEKCYFGSGKPYLYVGESTVPTLFLINDFHPSRGNVTVDDGAVPHIINGSNVFAQGITEMDPAIKKGDMVYIRNRSNQYIAVGVADRDASDIMENKKGQVITLMHFPGDKILKKFYS